MSLPSVIAFFVPHQLDFMCLRSTSSDVEVLTVDLHLVGDDDEVNVGCPAAIATTTFPVSALHKNDGPVKTGQFLLGSWYSLWRQGLRYCYFDRSLKSAELHCKKPDTFPVTQEVFVYQAVFHSLEPLFTVENISHPK